ncbi:Gfo/Idh/MocA family oxidoreductase [Nocardia transvalensis]|nr:Gfo/Idh/MocA family oxidoreductase [Nocardia transvalensis]
MRPCNTLYVPIPPVALPRPLRPAANVSLTGGRSADGDKGALRAALVGLGRRAISDHLPCLQAADDVQLVAVCDEDRIVLRRQQRQLGVPGYTDFREMFATEGLDLAVVCVPHDVGRDVIRAAASNKVHVLKEKPFATTLAEAKELSELCERSGIQLMVALQRRLDPIHASFQLLADQVGSPFLVEGRYTMHVADPSEGWRGQSGKAGGGCVIDMGYHLIDLVLWYFGLPDRIMADLSANARLDRHYDAEDTALVHFWYRRGLYGSLLFSRFLGPKTEELRLVGPRGVVHLERDRICRLSNSGDVIETLGRERLEPSAGVNQIDYFTRVINGTRPNLSGPADQLPHLAFVTACYQAARTHTLVSPKEFL